MNYQHLPSPVAFRQDINGLRAWAVIAVLLFHFSLIGLPGGFVGVDIFFVISGFLMTQIIVVGHEKGNFSILKFYMARARRILPALIVLSAVLLIVGWFLLPDVDYQALAKQVIVSLSFVGNYYFMLISGDYFAIQQSEIWMLHSWSLAVEAQFYLLFPIIVALVWRIKPTRNAMLSVLILTFFLSFLSALYVNSVDSKISFYALPTRAWELAVGGIVFLLSSRELFAKRFKPALHLIGWGMLFISFIFIEESIIWPGLPTLLPVFGTALIILVANQSSLLTENIVAQWIGDRSYSIYLWHWPIVVILSFAMLSDNWLWVLLAIALSILMGALSYALVEVPTRKFLSKSLFRKELILIGISVMVIIAASLLIKTHSFSGRINPLVQIAANEAANYGESRMDCLTGLYGSDNYQPGCKIGIPSEIGAILIGDSHSASVASALSKAAGQHGKSIHFRGMNDCSTIIEVERYAIDMAAKRRREACVKFNGGIEKYLGQFDASIPLVIVNRFNLVYSGLDKTLTQGQLKANQKINHNLKQLVKTLCMYQEKRQVYVINSIPEFGFSVPKKLSRHLIFSSNVEDIKIPKEKFIEKNKLIWQAQTQAHKLCGVEVLDTTNYLCDDQYCYGSIEKRPLYFDSNHLSEHGNKFLVPMFDKFLFSE